MAGNIYLYSFNNYTNRIVKKYDTLAEYGTPLYSIIDSVNFKPGDGVTTKQVVYFDEANKADYLIYTNIAGDIVSRWFIIESMRLSQNNYELSLKRDIIADNYDVLNNSTALIEKAILPDTNPLIYNNEPIFTNQIKTKEIELKDDTKAAWIVGYIARNTSYDNGSSTDKNKMTFETNVIVPDITVASLSDWTYNKYVGKKITGNLPDPFFDFALKDYNFSKKAYRNFSYNSSVTEEFANSNKFDDALRIYSFDYFMTWLKNKESDIKSKNSQYSKLYFPENIQSNQSDYSSLLTFNGKILKAGSDYYRIHLTSKSETFKVDINENKQGDYMYKYLYDLFNSYDSKFIYDHGFYGRYVWNCTTAVLTLEPMTYGSYSCNFPDENSRYHLKDAPYDMFAIPYSDTGWLQGLKHNKTLALSIAQELSRKLDANLYDMQLLPYCPFGGYTVNSTGNMILTDTNAKKVTRIVDANDTTKLYMIWCAASSGTKNIILSEGISYTNKKLANQCDMYRLVSPNFNGQFEFNLAKNDTQTLDTFNVDFTYMPYNPYIHITPVPFSGLYGQDFNDARGLICGGDFSLARITDAWQSYQLQNKNYQAIFNRQIENMEVNRKVNKGMNTASAIMGSFGTSAQGFMVGGAAGAIVGGVLGLTSGIGDTHVEDLLAREQMSYAGEIHNLELGNIQALPYSLSRTTAYTENNKIFPIVEYYTCTDEEKTVVAQEIINSSMTVGIIGTIGDYIGNEWSYNDAVSRGFIKGQIIELKGFNGDGHEALDLKQEFQKGVYING